VGREEKDIIEMSAYDSIDVLAHCVKRMKELNFHLVTEIYIKGEKFYASQHHHI
jgi:hypothetical protein